MHSGDLDPVVQESWARVRGRLRAEVGEAAFRSWLKPLTLVNSKSGSVRMAVPTRFMRDWVQSNYADRIRLLGETNTVERAELGRRLRERVEAGHSVQSWARGVLDAAGVSR